MTISREEYNDLLRYDLSGFAQQAFSTVDPGTPYLHNWHIDLICDYLTACTNGDIKRLIINMPPRMMKSLCVSVAWPAWMLGKNPSEQIMVASYSQVLSNTHSMNCRHVIASEWYKDCFPDTRLAADQNEKSKFKTTQQGHRIATSLGGSATGEGGNFLIVDDPTNPKQALSDVERTTANTDFSQTFTSRLNNKLTGVIVVVMQRLHQGDLTGHLLEQGGYEHLVIRQETEQETIYSFPYAKGNPIIMMPGQLMHPERMNDEAVEREKKQLGAYGYAAQQQQRPAPLGGGEFKQEWIQRYRRAPRWEEMNIYILVDPAFTDKDTSDYTAMFVWGLAPDNNYYWLDCIRDKLNPTQRVNAAMNLHKKWNKLANKPPIMGWEIYAAQNTDAHYIKEAQEKANYRFPLIEYRGGMSKNDRIRTLIPLFENRRVYFPLNLPYTTVNGEIVDLVKVFIDDEYIRFPVGITKDMIDAAARITDPAINAIFPMLDIQTLSERYGMEDEETKDWFDQ